MVTTFTNASIKSVSCFRNNVVRKKRVLDLRKRRIAARKTRVLDLRKRRIAAGAERCIYLPMLKPKHNWS